MLDQLVESKSHAGEDTRRSSFLLTTFVIMTSILLSAWLYSLFAKDYGMGGDELSLETLVAPPVIEDQPEPEPEKEPEKQKDPNVDVRKEIIASMDEPPPKIPDKISSEASKIPPRDPDKFTVVGDRNFSAANAPPPDYAGPVNASGTGSDSGNTGQGGTSDVGGAPPPPPPPKKVVPKQISGGVLNGKATSLPKPAYPPAARAVRASGAVNVQVVISESGSVISATAVSGHPLLRAAAVGAARGARFSPTQLSGQPVKVSGVITYNFVP
ncbi:MAG: TonB family protein [Saprospiraceae bacterium]|nr:TonB family protein [Pyrinomonadaceae bacterium]